MQQKLWQYNDRVGRDRKRLSNGRYATDNQLLNEKLEKKKRYIKMMLRYFLAIQRENIRLRNEISLLKNN